MKKFTVVILTIILSFSSIFAAVKTPSARKTAIDLQNIFGENQLGLGYDSGQFGEKSELAAALYSDFGTESLRFTINILELGGSMFNNGELADGTTMPWVQGLPQFFVGAGYIINDTIRLGLGYGGKLSQSKYGSGWYANNAGLYFQADFDDYNILKVGIPFLYGMGYGTTSVGGIAGKNDDYENKNMSALAIAPEIRWQTELGYLTEVRLTVPFGMSTIKQQFAIEEYATKSIGVDLEVFLTFITDPVIFAFVPRIDYQMALDGNYLTTDVIGGNIASNYYRGISGYSIEKPWQATVDLAFEISTESDMVYVWAGPKLRLMAAGGSKVLIDGTSGTKSRKEMFYGLGYALPIEASIRPDSNLEINLGLLGEGSPFTGNPGKLEVTVDGSVIWYF